MKPLTDKEQNKVAVLIRLGDSKEQAIETVLKERELKRNSEDYKKAYWS